MQADGRYRKPVEGTPFGRYQLIELLGRGGMGEVWRAYDSEIDRVVALKMLLPHLTEDPEFEKRFRREVRAAARLDDRHVVPIYDVGEIDGRLYVTMRLIAGTDLNTLLDAGPLDPQRAVKIIEQIAAALHNAHVTGLVHRDVKPSNILLDENDFAYLIDFGIARTAEDGVTQTGAAIGTWAYMAPERFSTDEIHPSSDIYALACVLYECVTGQQPFPGNTLEKIASGHIFMPPPRPSEISRTVPTALDEVIATGLAKTPSDRYPTAVDMASAAREVITRSSQPNIPRPSRPRAPSVSQGGPPGPPMPPQQAWGQPHSAAPGVFVPARERPQPACAAGATAPEASEAKSRCARRRAGVHHHAHRRSRCHRRRGIHFSATTPPVRHRPPRRRVGVNSPAHTQPTMDRERIWKTSRSRMRLRRRAIGPSARNAAPVVAWRRRRMSVARVWHCCRT